MDYHYGNNKVDFGVLWSIMHSYWSFCIH